MTSDCEHKRALVAIQASLPYKVGCILREAFHSPLKKGILLPFSLLKLFIDSKRSNFNWLPAAIGSKKKWIPNKTIYINPSREVHSFNFLTKTGAVRNSTDTRVRIGCLMDNVLFNYLSFDAECLVIPLDNWSDWLDNFLPELVLINSHWPILYESDSKGRYPVSDENSLSQFLLSCKERGIETVYWHTEDVIHVPLFAAIAAMCTHIFTSDDICYEKFRASSPHLVRGVLPPAVQPVVHNPIKDKNSQIEDFPFLYDGWADLLDEPEVLSELMAKLLNQGLYVVESSCLLMANKLDDLPVWRSHIKGCVSEEQRVALLKQCSIMLMPTPTLASSVVRCRKMLESIACDAIVVGCGSEFLESQEDIRGLVKDTYIVPDNNGCFADTAKQILVSSESRTRALHLARREIYKNHTYTHRLQTIFKFTGIQSSWEENLPVTVITPTKRPHLFQACMDNYDAQTYPNKEWIVVVNKNDAHLSTIRALTGNRADIRIEVVHQEKNIGSCLNYGASLGKGNLWFKMDDDDFYGPNYLWDMVLAWKTSRADLIGKPPAYIYFEKNDVMYLRKTHCYANSIAVKDGPHFCGATLAGTVKALKKSPFSEDFRACVDSIFFEISMAKNMKMHFVDPYNFITCRSNDKNTHTWRPKNLKVGKSMKQVCIGKGQKIVYL